MSGSIEGGDGMINNPNLPEDFEVTQEMLDNPVIRFFFKYYTGGQYVNICRNSKSYAIIFEGIKIYFEMLDESDDNKIWPTVAFLDIPRFSEIIEQISIDGSDRYMFGAFMGFTIDNMEITNLGGMEITHIDCLTLFVPKEQREEFKNILVEYGKLVGPLKSLTIAIKGIADRVVDPKSGDGVIEDPEVIKYISEFMNAQQKDIQKIIDALSS